MSEKMFNLLSALVGCALTAIDALLAYFEPANQEMYVTIAGVLATATIQILSAWEKKSRDSLSGQAIKA